MFQRQHWKNKIMETLGEVYMGLAERFDIMCTEVRCTKIANTKYGLILFIYLRIYSLSTNTPPHCKQSANKARGRVVFENNG